MVYCISFNKVYYQYELNDFFVNKEQKLVEIKSRNRFKKIFRTKRKKARYKKITIRSNRVKLRQTTLDEWSKEIRDCFGARLIKNFIRLLFERIKSKERRTILVSRRKKGTYKQLSLEEFTGREEDVPQLEKKEISFTPSKNPKKISEDVAEGIIVEQLADLTKSESKIASTISKQFNIEISKSSVGNLLRYNKINKLKKWFLIPRIRTKLKDKIKVLGENNEGAVDISKKESKIFFRGDKYSPGPFLRKCEEGLISQTIMGLFHEKFLQELKFFEVIFELIPEKRNGFNQITYFRGLYYMPFLKIERFDHFNYIDKSKISPLIGNLKGFSSSALNKYLNQLVKKIEITSLELKFRQELKSTGQIDGRAAYFDEHVILFYSEENLKKVKSGIYNKIGKGIINFESFCPINGNTIFRKSTTGGTTLETELFSLISGTETVTGTPLILIGHDRGIKGKNEFLKIRERKIHFVCWNMEYKEIKDKISQISESNFKFLEMAIEEILQFRNERQKGPYLSSDTRQLAEIMEILISNNYLQDRVKENYEKNIGKIKQKKRDILRIADTRLELEELGKIRVIVLERRDGKKISIRTSIDDNSIHAIEILYFLKRRQLQEDQFKLKKSINGDNIFGRKYIEEEYIFTEQKRVVQPPSIDDLLEFEDEKKKLENKILKKEAELENQNLLLKEKKISKSEFNSLNKRTEKALKRYKEMLVEIIEFIDWGKNGAMPSYFKKFRPVKELDLRKDNLIQLFRDIYLAISKKITKSLSDCAKELKNEGIEEVKNKLAKRIEKFTPKSLNNIFLDQKGMIFLNNNNPLKLLITIDKYDDDQRQIIMKRYIQYLNKSNISMTLSKSLKIELGFSLKNE